MKYIAKEGPKIETKPGCWLSTTVEIWEGDKKVGEYLRNYDGYSEDTFVPFEQNGKWYALYSKDYTCTRVMSLPDCKDLGGEESAAHGFCPTGYYVPTKEDLSHWYIPEEDWHKEEDGRLSDTVKKIIADQKIAYAELDTKHVGQFGFISGCHWGDDSSWKLEYLDLSRVSEDIIKREARFGYWELPNGKSIKECLDFEHYELPGFTQIDAIKKVSIPLLDRNWNNIYIDDIYEFPKDHIFNGLKVKVLLFDIDGANCSILKSANTLNKPEIYIPEYMFDRRYKISSTNDTYWLKEQKGENPKSKVKVTYWKEPWTWKAKRRLKYLFTGKI